MKCISLFVIYFTLQSTLVFSRTVDDVLVDFQPVFDEIHNEILSLQILARDHGASQVYDIRITITQYSWETQEALEKAMHDIRDQVEIITDENGMIGHEDLIKHCMVKKDEGIVSLSGDKNAGSNVCNELGNKAIDKLNNILNEYYKEQSTWRTNLESVKEMCEDKTTPLDMQTCLIQHLYFLHKPHVQEMRRQMDTFIESNKQYVKRVVGDIKVCFSIVSEKTQNDRLPIIADFKKCVVEAAENKP